MRDARTDLDRLFAAAGAARAAHAYSPYSGFPVGAAILCEDGRIFAGCNVENASYPVGTCAEAAAISAMVAEGGRRIAAALVLAAGDPLVTPCGACRQRIREFAGEAVAIHLARPDGIARTLDDRRTPAVGPSHPTRSSGPANRDETRSDHAGLHSPALARREDRARVLGACAEGFGGLRLEDRPRAIRAGRAPVTS